ncbi:hypothetical protein D3C76_1723210 [compost metagenome]
MGLAEQGRHQHPAALAYVATGQLIGENGLASARWPLNDVGSTRNQTALEQCIEPRYPRHQPLEYLCHGGYPSS